MSYFGELRVNWRALVASALGQGAGLSLQTYVVSIFAPHLLKDFGWTKAQFALVGTTTLMTLVCVPIVGRLTDIFGVRRIATVGVVCMPLSFPALSGFSGDIREYVAISLLQIILGTSTTATVYSRLVAERFTRARGLALAIVAAWPAVVGAAGGPILTAFIHTHGWRAGYQSLAAFSAVVGVLTLLLIPRGQAVGTRTTAKPRRASQDYSLIARSATFWLLASGVFLCNLPQTLNTMQLKLMLLDNGLSSTAASTMVSVFAIGVIVGRFVCGVALDRLPTHHVATLGMGLPSIGMFVIASGYDAPIALAIAALLLGLSQGAEGDIMAYVTMRFFGVEIYSTVLGLVIAVLGIATTIGAVLLSVTLKETDSFAPFVFFGGVVTVIGSALFMLLKRASIVRTPEVPMQPNGSSVPLRQEPTEALIDRLL